MKQILLFISAIYFITSANGQPVDSVKISMGEANREEEGWHFTTMYVDSFSSGLKKSFLTMTWQNNLWENSSLNSYTYDTTGNLLETILENRVGVQWVNSKKWIHAYNLNNQLLTKVIQIWNAGVWQNSSIETHYLDASGNDSLIIFSAWRNSAWIDSAKTFQLFNTLSFLTEATTSIWDTLTGSWRYTKLYVHAPDSSGRDSTIIYKTWNYVQWKNSDMWAYHYDSLGSITFYGEYWWTDTAWWFVTETNYSYNALHQLTGYTWDCYYGACGPADGDYQYDSDGNLIYSHSYSETMGGIPNESRWHYYYMEYPSTQLHAYIIPDFEICSADSIPIGAFAFGGIPPLHFQWSPASGLSSDSIENPIVTADTSTTYIFTVTDSAGNNASDTITITVNPSPVANISIQLIDTTTLCNSALLATDSLEQIFCTWYFNGATQTNYYGNGAAHLQIDENGWYKVEVRNYYYGCIAYDSIEINLMTNPAPSISIVNNCNTLVAQGTGIQSYQWYKNFVAIPGAVADTFPVVENNSYYVVVTDSDGCSNMSNRLFVRPWYGGFGQFATCHDTCNGQLNGGGVYGTEPYTYLWSTGATTQYLYNMCAGYYTLTVTDARGCVDSFSDSLRYLPEYSLQIISSMVADSALCNGVSFVTVNGQLNPVDYYYSWNNGSTSFNAGNLCSGWNYVQVMSSSRGCTQTDSFFVNTGNPGDSCGAIAISNNPTCYGYCNGGIELTGFTGVAPFHYFWINPLSEVSNMNLTGLCAGNYSLLLIDSSGCADTLTRTITNPDSIQGTFSILYANPNEPCSTLVSLALINDNQPSSIYWQCNVDTGEQTYLCPGNCEVLVQDQIGCTASFTIDVPDSITACSVIPLSQNILCYGNCDGDITAVANGVPPFNFLWSTGATGVSIGSLCAGSYQVIMTDSVGCIDSATVVLTQPSAISSSIISSYLNCQCSFTANVAGGISPYTYLWCNNNTAPQMLNCNPGLCSLTITDANGCQFQDSVLIIPSPPVSISGSSIAASCHGCNDGAVNGVVTGGTAPFLYTLQPGGITNTSGFFTGLVAGNYTICVSDINSCVSCTPVTVTEPSSSCSVTIISVNTILCYGDCTGSLTAVANGVPPFHFLWSNNDTNATINNLCAGTYSVVMTDGVGCVTTTSATVTEPPPLTATYTTLYGCSTCTTIGTVTGGTPPYTYMWCDGSTGQQSFFCGPGVCVVNVVDGNGCLITDTIILTPPPPLSLNTTANGTNCAGCSDGIITGTAFGGNPPYLYTLNPTGTTNTSGNFSGLPAGNYQLCVTDANNCTTCDSITVADDPTGIPSRINDELIRVYPNPFTDETTLEVSQELLKKNPEIIILDLLGNELSLIAVHHNLTTIEKKNLTAGVYFYKLKIEGKISANGKLIIVD